MSSNSVRAVLEQQAQHDGYNNNVGGSYQPQTPQGPPTLMYQHMLLQQQQQQQGQQQDEGHAMHDPQQDYGYDNEQGYEQEGDGGYWAESPDGYANQGGEAEYYEGNDDLYDDEGRRNDRGRRPMSTTRSPRGYGGGGGRARSLSAVSGRSRSPRSVRSSGYGQDAKKWSSRGRRADSFQAVPPYPGGDSRDEEYLYGGGSMERELSRRLDVMEECTFRPAIKELPAHYGALKDRDVPFHQRVMRWRSEKESEKKRRSMDHDSSLMEDCTFAPALSKKTEDLARRATRGLPARPTERLFAYVEHRRQQRELEASEAKAREDLEFSQVCTFRPSINKHSQEVAARAGRGHHAQDPTEAALARSMAVHEQHPMAGGVYGHDMSGSGGDFSQSRASLSHSLLSRSYSAVLEAATAKSKSRPPPTGAEECSFKPTVNPVPAEFASARLYLQTPIFQRLSTNVTAATQGQRAPGVEGGGQVRGDVSIASSIHSFQSLGSGGGGGGDGDVRFDRDDLDAELLGVERRRPASAPRRRLSGTGSERGSERGGGGGSVSGSVTAEEMNRRREAFRQFYMRQQQKEKKKEKKLEKARESLIPKHQPALNDNSRRIADRSFTGNFLQRVEHGKLRRENERARREAASKDTECTFAPQILDTSRGRRGRSVVEMSRGDMLKKETSQRLMKLKVETEELSHLPFQPVLNQTGVAATAKSRLQIASDPDNYLLRLQRQAKAFSEKKRRAAAEAEVREFEECTFAPKTTRAPAYIKRIARSMALTQNRRGDAESEIDEKPDWR